MALFQKAMYASPAEALETIMDNALQAKSITPTERLSFTMRCHGLTINIRKNVFAIVQIYNHLIKLPNRKAVFQSFFSQPADKYELKVLAGVGILA